MRIIMLTILLGAANLSVAQIAFFKQFADEGYDVGQGIVQVEDSGFLVTGSSSSFTDYQTQAFLLRTDKYGEYMWSRAYGGDESDWGRRVLYKEGYGIYIAGYTSSYGNGGYDFYLIKTDLTGNMEWDKSYGGSEWERVHDAALLSDTGVVMVGETNSNPTSNKDIYIVRTDKYGDTVWTKTIGGIGEDWATSVEVYQDTILLIGGTIFIEDSLKQKGFLASIHSNSGLVYWIDSIGANGNYLINDIDVINDTLDAVGTHWIDTSDFLDIYYFKLQVQGNNTLLSYAPDNLYDGDFRGICFTSYGDNSKRYVAYNIIASFTYPYGEDAHYGRFSTGFGWQGQVVQVVHEHWDESAQLIPTSDGGAASVGWSDEGGYGGSTVYVLKIGPNEFYPTVSGVTAYSNLVSIAEIASAIDTKIYPNPARDKVNVAGEAGIRYTCMLYNPMGSVVSEYEFYGNGELNIADLPDGVYLMNLSDETGGKLVARLIISH